MARKKGSKQVAARRDREIKQTACPECGRTVQTYINRDNVRVYRIHKVASMRENPFDLLLGLGETMFCSLSGEIVEQ